MKFQRVRQTFNIYCDESCHLEHDSQPAMVLGAVWCPLEKAQEIAVRLREIKAQHGLPRDFELKWGKVSPAQLEFYKDILDYFFDDDDLYYKMYFDLLKVILSPEAVYRIFLDIKDSRSANKVSKLQEVLSNEKYDFHREIVERVQMVRSHEVEALQLADLLIGIISYANRGLTSSPAKLALVDRMRQRSGYHLTQTTLLRENKVNLFCWRSS